MPLLSIHGVSLSFLGLRCLDSVSFNIEPGEIVGLIGPNGAGKTTIVNVLSGFLRANTGTIEFAGQRIDRVSPHRIARMGLRRTFQTSKLYSGMDVLENVSCGLDSTHSEYGFFNAGVRSRRLLAAEADTLSKVKDSLGRFGFPEQLAGSDGRSLSFGQQRLVELARSTVSPAKLLILDEPAVGLAAPRIDELAKQVRCIAREQGTAVLLIEHMIDLVLDLCDRVVVMAAGSVIADGDPKTVTSEPLVIESYLGRRHHAAR